MEGKLTINLRLLNNEFDFLIKIVFVWSNIVHWCLLCQQSQPENGEVWLMLLIKHGLLPKSWLLCPYLFLKNLDWPFSRIKYIVFCMYYHHTAIDCTMDGNFQWLEAGSFTDEGHHDLFSLQTVFMDQIRCILHAWQKISPYRSRKKLFSDTNAALWWENKL